MILAGIPVRPEDVCSPHAPGAIATIDVLTESLTSPASPAPDSLVVVSA